MADAKYGVEVELKKVGDGWNDLSEGVGKFSGLLDAAAGKIARLGAAAVVGAAVGAFAAATYGVSKLNAEAEGAAISIGTIFSVNGIAANVPAGITMAQEQIAKMRVDAQKLPGEFEDLQKIFMTGAIPMFQAGATADQARKLSAQVMAAGAVMGLQSDMTAREFGMLLSGRSGAHNIFGTRLGFSGAKAKELNAADPSKRLEMVSKETQKYSGAIDIFAHSYEGLSSTLVDNVKNFARLGSAPLFESVKETMSDINDWFGKNQDEVNRFAAHLGIGLKEGFEWGRRKIEEWYPIILNFVDVAQQRLVALWDEVKPGVEAFGAMIKDALTDPNGTIDKLKELFELYAAVKIGGGLLGGAGALGGMAKGAGGIMSGLGLLGEGSAAAGAVGATGASTAVLGLDIGAAGVGAVFLAAVAAWGAAVWQGVGLYNEVHAQEMANEQAKADAHGREITRMIKAGATSDELDAKMKEMAASYGETKDAFGNITKMGDATGWALNDVAVAAALAAAGLAALSPNVGQKASEDAAERANRDSGMANFMTVMGKALPTAAEAAAKKAPVMKGGHGGTSIQKVEIVVTSNQSPSRIARAVHADLAKLSQNRRASPFVRNFSARDE